MSKKPTSGGRSADYEVGYGKPPKEHRFKAKLTPTDTGRATSERKKRKAGDRQAVDVYALLIEPVQVRKGERVQSMDPFEAMLRKQLELALKERSAAAMKEIIDVAIEHKLIAKSLKISEGGVLVIPVATSEDLDLFVSLPTRANSSQDRGRR